MARIFEIGVWWNYLDDALQVELQQALVKQTGKSIRGNGLAFLDFVVERAGNDRVKETWAQERRRFGIAA